MNSNQYPEWVISSRSGWFNWKLKECFSYKDLLFRLVRKNFLGFYQQTLLGPFWILFSPVVTVFTYVIVFNKVIGIPTEGVPSFVYYMAGVTLWNLFSESLLNTSSTLSANADIFKKVYFPRIIAPVSGLLITIINFGIQFTLFILILAFLYISGNIDFNFLHFILFIPALLLVTMFGFGTGLIFSVITTKYRDLSNVIQLIVRICMFITPVFYSVTIIPEKLKAYVLLNPLAPLFELYRFAFFNVGQLQPAFLLYSIFVSVLVVILGLAAYSKYNGALMDVV